MNSEQSGTQANPQQPSYKALIPDVKARSAQDAAILLAEHPAATIYAVLLELNPGLAQAILAELPGGLQDGVLQAVAPEISQQWRRNQTYGQGSIGRLMEPVYAVFHPAMTVAQTVERLRALIKVAFITYGYVIDESGTLRGLITMRDLLFAPDDTRLESLMLRDVFTLRPETPLSEAMRSVLDRHYPVYPVCNASGVLIGLVRGQAMFEEQAFEITAQVGTMVGVEKEERLVTPLFQSFRFRHPWLQLNLLTAFIAGAVVAIFQDTVDRLVILALFLPVLAGQSGNTGCQALAVTLRGITLGELKEGKERELVVKEASLGLYNGVFTGLVAGIGMLIVAILQNNPHALQLALVVWAALVGACVTSGVCGALIPITLKRFGLDPATASSIFLTTATDVVSMGMLLGLAALFIR
ncbi:MAG: magnesium transporter [Burkholderiales bacterium]